MLIECSKQAIYKIETGIQNILSNSLLFSLFSDEKGGQIVVAKTVLKTVAAYIVVILIIVVIHNTFFKEKMELNLDEQDVKSVKLCYLGRMEDDTKNLDVEEFVKYYNMIYDVRENKDGIGSTPETKIIIELKSGEIIEIYDPGFSFEVNIQSDNGEIKQYWGRQENIDNMLNEGEY